MLRWRHIDLVSQHIAVQPQRPPGGRATYFRARSPIADQPLEDGEGSATETSRRSPEGRSRSRCRCRDRPDCPGERPCSGHSASRFRTMEPTNRRLPVFLRGNCLGERLHDLIAFWDPPTVQTEPLMDHSGQLAAA